MATVEEEVCLSCHRTQGQRHIATTTIPKASTLTRWKKLRITRATDGCKIPWGIKHCEHGHEAWNITLTAYGVKGRVGEPEENVDPFGGASTDATEDDC